MTQRVLQNSFLGGEISPTIFGRTDNNIYTSGVQECTNFYIQPQGSILSRTGLQYVMSAINSNKKVRLIPFRFASDQTLVLVFGDYTLNIVTQGKILLDENNKIYQVSTQYKAEDLDKLNYCQNADIVTITSTLYPPTELRRYGATDWRFNIVTTSPTIQAPTNLAVTANYPSDTDAKDRGKITATYCVTAIDENNRESLASKSVSVQCNYYVTGGSVTISWNATSGAKRYRIYRSVVGVFSFIGETTSTSVVDEGDTPDGTQTPPLYSTPFKGSKSIIKVNVKNGGSGYGQINVGGASSLPTTLKLPMFVLPFSAYLKEASYDIKPYLRFAFEVFSNKNTILHKQNVGLEYISWQSGPNGMGDTLFYGVVAPLGFTQDYILANFTKSVSGQNLRLRIRIEASGVPSYLDIGFILNNWYSIYKKTSINYTHDCYYYTVDKEDPYFGFSLNFNYGTYGSIISQEQLKQKVVKQSLKTHWAISQLLSENGCLISDILELEQLGYENEEVAPTTIKVTDTTGTGAILTPIIENGVITAVSIVNGGSNYTAPKLEVISDTGKGAVLEAVISSDSNLDYPQAVTQYDQRRVFGGSNSNPLKVWFTNAGQQDLMMYHLPVQADDRIEITAVTADADKIKHAVALDSLILFTGSSELRVFTQNSDSLSPSSVAVRAQSYIGANDVQPIIINNVIVYCANRGGHLRALQYAYTSSGYNSTDISLIANHLFDNKEVVDLALSKSPIQNVLAVSSSGQLLISTMYPEENINAWSKFVTQGQFESVCAVTEGEQDVIYCVVKRTINNKTVRYVERFAEFNKTNVRQLDSFIDKNGGLTTTQSGNVMTIKGLNHLNNEKVTVVVDDKEFTNVQVTNNQCTVNATGSDVYVGIPFVSSVVTLPLASSQVQGNLQGVVKNISQTYVRVGNKGDLYANNYGNDNLFLVQDNNPDESLSSRVLQLSLSGEWDLQGQIKFEHRNTQPLEIQAIIGNVRLEGAK